MTGPVDPVGDSMRGQNPGRPTLAAGRVITAPDAVGDMLTVQVFGWPAKDAYEIPGDHWMPRANPAPDDDGGSAPPLIPQVGSRVVCIEDHLGDIWVAVWG